MRDLDLIGIGMIMGEISPPRSGLRIGETPHLLLTPSGSATNFMAAYVKLGGRAAFISRVGDDDLGRWIVSELDRIGIDTSAIAAVPGQLTPFTLASVDERGNKTFSFYRFPGYCEPLLTLEADEIQDAFLERAALFDLAEASLRAVESRTTAMALARRAKSAGAAVCVNPNYRPNTWGGGNEEARAVLRAALAIADGAVMNLEELRLIGGEGEPEQVMRQLSALGPDTIVVTDGGQPIRVLDRGEYAEIAVPPVTVVYDVGAGDVFHAGLLACWRPGADAVACARFAAAAAALKISRPPSLENLPTADEVEGRLREMESGGGARDSKSRAE